jgi:hypothetical protein
MSNHEAFDRHVAEITSTAPRPRSRVLSRLLAPPVVGDSREALLPLLRAALIAVVAQKQLLT